MQLTTNNVSDSQVLEGLLAQIPLDERIDSVYTDGTYDTKQCFSGRALWKKGSGYHRRSLVETKMHCIKLLDDKLTAKSFSSQVNEIHARVAVLNRFTELGCPHTQVSTELWLT